MSRHRRCFPPNRLRQVGSAPAVARAVGRLLLILVFALQADSAPTAAEENQSIAEKEGHAHSVLALSMEQQRKRQVFGGVNVAKAQGFDFVVALHNSTGELCGGSIISSEWILTAAHCGKIEEVIVGRPFLPDLSVGQTLAVADCQRHAGWDSQTYADDLAMVKIVPHGEALKTISLPTDDSWETGSPPPPLTILGWGDYCQNGPLQLCRSNVTKAGEAECRHQYQKKSPSITITGETFCTGTGVTRVTPGDSGGPLVAEIGDQLTLVGVISYGISANVPDRHMKVTEYADWIGEVQAGTATTEPCGQ